MPLVQADAQMVTMTNSPTSSVMEEPVKPHHHCKISLCSPGFALRRDKPQRTEMRELKEPFSRDREKEEERQAQGGTAAR